MRRLLLLGVALAALGAPGAAEAGCWTTVGLSPLPDGTKAGATWTVDVTVLQHGRTPYVGAKPSVTIRNQSTGKAVRFPARATSRAGIYRANVRFPAAGSWFYEVNDDFTECGGTGDVHELGAVAVSSGSGGSSFPLWPVLGGALGALGLVGASALAVRLRPRRAPAASGA